MKTKKFVKFERYGAMTEKYSSAKGRKKHEKVEGKKGEGKEKAMTKKGKKG